MFRDLVDLQLSLVANDFSVSLHSDIEISLVYLVSCCYMEHGQNEYLAYLWGGFNKRRFGDGPYFTS